MDQETKIWLSPEEARERWNRLRVKLRNGKTVYRVFKDEVGHWHPRFSQNQYPLGYEYVLRRCAISAEPLKRGPAQANGSAQGYPDVRELIGRRLIGGQLTFSTGIPGHGDFYLT